MASKLYGPLSKEKEKACGIFVNNIVEDVLLIYELSMPIS